MNKRYLEYRIVIEEIAPSMTKVIDKAITGFRENFNEQFKPAKLYLYESENQTKALEAKNDRI